MLIQIKSALRFTGNARDTEIQDNISSALLELSRVGVDVSGLDWTSGDADKLIVKACEIYCKWQFDFLEKGEKFERNFKELCNALAVTSAYLVSENE